MNGMEQQGDADCDQCGHPFDPHSLIATTGDPLDGGIILCPVPGCLCYATWGVQGAEPKLVPDEVGVTELRRRLQAA